ncbi:MAG: YihY/virulence factor BrkB family protein [Sumerlaeia bacterium]
MKKAVTFLTHDIWRIRMSEQPFKRRLLLRPLRMLIMAGKEFGTDKCALHASALTFYTLLSIVPVLALAFGVAKGFGLHETLESKVRDVASGKNLVEVDMALAGAEAPTTPVLTVAAGDSLASPAMAGEGEATLGDLSQGQAEVVDQLINFASNMLDNAKGGVVAGLGVFILLWTVIKLLGHIEGSFNTIWHVHTGRSWVRKFSDYLSVMLVSPVLFLTSTSITAFIASQFLAALDQSTWLAFLSGPARALLIAVPSLLYGLMFAFVYLFIPNTKVKPLSAIFGGLCAGVLYQLTQFAFVKFQVGISGANAIYGTFAALPLFLTWLNLSWMIVLLGAELAYAHQFSDLEEIEEASRPISQRAKRLAALCLVRECVEDFAAGQPASSAEDLCARVGMPIGVTSDILSELVDCGLLSEVLRKGQVEGYQPGTDIGNLRVADVVLKLDAHGREDFQMAETEERKQLEEIMATFRESLEKSEKNKVLKDGLREPGVA